MGRLRAERSTLRLTSWATSKSASQLAREDLANRRPERRITGKTIVAYTSGKAPPEEVVRAGKRELQEGLAKLKGRKRANGVVPAVSPAGEGGVPAAAYT